MWLGWTLREWAMCLKERTQLSQFLPRINWPPCVANKSLKWLTNGMWINYDITIILMFLPIFYLEMELLITNFLIKNPHFSPRNPNFLIFMKIFIFLILIFNGRNFYNSSLILTRYEWPHNTQEQRLKKPWPQRDSNSDHLLAI